MELEACQLMVFEAAMHPEDMEFLPDRTWHTGEASELRVGGLLSRLNERLKPVYFEYECLIHNGRIINSVMQ